MKESIKYIIGIVCLLIGFTTAWFMKDSQYQDIVESENQNIIESENQTSEIFTCSMHPQIRQNEPGDCAICGMDLIPLASNTSSDPLVLQMTQEAVKLASIQTTVLGESSVSSEKRISLSGKVQADERLASSQVAHVPGRIEKLYVSFTGEQVYRGQKIATLYSPDLINAQRELLEAIKLKELNPNLLDAARNKLKYWKISEEVIAEIEKHGSIKETFDVMADESGIVTNRRVSVGDYINQGGALFDLMSLRKVWVLFDAYEEDLSNFRIGDPIEFSTKAIPSKIFRSVISFIDPMINPETRVASIRTELNNPGRLLKPEMLVYGSMHKQYSEATQLTVPKTAVLWTGKRSVVYVKVPDQSIPSFQFREIEIGESLGREYMVLSGLEAGEEVVTHGSFTIDAAAQLNNQASIMNKNVKTKDEGAPTLPDYTTSTPQEFKQQLAEVSQAYLDLKNALVETDPEESGKAAARLTSMLDIVDMSLVKDDAHLFWMDQLTALKAHGGKIAELEDVEEQRGQFDFLSQVLIDAIKVFGVANDTLYVQHCPMAFDNSGADWISDVKEIRNPYFGDKMLKCGVIKAEITANFQNPNNNL